MGCLQPFYRRVEPLAGRKLMFSAFCAVARSFGTNMSLFTIFILLSRGWMLLMFVVSTNKVFVLTYSYRIKTCI